MKVNTGNTKIIVKTWMSLGLVMLLLLLASPAFSQNTKGDRPSNRENRFKIPSKKTSQKRKNPRNKRIRSKSKSTSSSAQVSTAPRRRARGGDHVGRPVRPVFRNKPENKQRAWRGDITGRRIRTKDASSSGRNVFPQRGRYVRKTVPEKQRAWKGSSSGSRVMVRSRSGKTKNVYSQSGRFVNSSSKPRKPTVVSNRSTLARLNRMQSGPQGSPPGKKKIRPRSASRSYIAHKTINIYARFPRPKKKSEQAHTKDIAGHPLRAKNFETKRPGVVAPTFKPYYGRKRVGDRPYKGPSGGYRSATKPGERAWTGDIAKRRIRHRDRSSKRSVEGTTTLFRGYKTRTKPGEKRPGISPLPGKTPGIGAERIGKFQGNIKGRRPLKGGGSVSGKVWNNRNTPINPRVPASRDAAKVGGYPGKMRRFQQSPGFANQGEEFTGTLKARRPQKGGGSVSGKLWNNKRQPIPARTYTQSERAYRFQGNIKSRRPAKGGGSVSGKLWNNKETPIPARTPPESARKQSGYPGNIRMFEQKPGFIDQGEEFTGHIKLSKFRKSYVQNKNASEESTKKRRPDKRAYEAEGLQVRVKRRNYVENKNSADDALLKLEPTKATRAVGELQVKVKRRDYVKNPHSAEDALLKLKPTKTTEAVGGLQVKVQRRKYVKNPNAAEDALMKLKPTRATQQVGELQVKVKQYHYIRNPNSAEDALRVREPGKAFARATAYQGNIKMQKFRLFDKNRELHPDARFVKTNKNNVSGERDTMTNFKLWWARLFKKQETQPDHLKEKGRKPRYDKGEQGLWND